jgi:hypothetical protein
VAQSNDVVNPDSKANPAVGQEHPALTEYRRRNRRAMSVYGLVLAAVVLLSFIAVKLIYAHGELVHVSQQSNVAPSPVPTASTAESVSLKWRTDDHPAGGSPYADGIVVTYSTNTVNGRDALTGAVRWHYTRTDRVLCGVVQQDSSTIAIYQHDKNCDEVTGFVTATGEPKFYRTLQDNGRVAISSAPNVVLVVAADDVHVFDNAGGLDRWKWNAPDGCTVNRALAGTKGVLISYRCGTDNHLSLHPLLDDKSVLWDVTTPELAVPVAAGAAVAAADPKTGLLTRYSADKGVPGTSTPLGDPSQVGPELQVLPKSQATLETVDDQGQLFEVVQVGDLIGVTPLQNKTWTAVTTGPASGVGNGLVAAAVGARVIQYSIDGGTIERTTTLTGTVPSGAFAAYPLGAGLLVAGTTTELYS